MKIKEFFKKYIALTEGEISDSGKIEGYIAREGESIIKRRFSAEETEDGEHSVTEYKVCSRSKDKSLVFVRPITGRTHQIRVHMSHTGHPLLGDEVYGGAKTRFQSLHKDCIHGQCLHAKELHLTHPTTNMNCTFTSELPDDFMRVLDLLEKTCT